MMFFSWSSLKQEVAPSPDYRIFCIRICLMSPWELSVAKSHVKGRFYFKMATVIFITVPIMLVFAAHIHQADDNAIFLSILMWLIGVIGVLRILYVFWRRSYETKLIEQELERRQFDRAGKHC